MRGNDCWQRVRRSEVALLSQLRHENVIGLKDLLAPPPGAPLSDVYLVRRCWLGLAGLAGLAWRAWRAVFAG